MDRFDDIGRIDDPSDILGILEVVGEVLPLVPPGLNYNGILRSPLLLQPVQLRLGRLFRDSLIDSFEILGELLLVFGGHALEGIADLVNDVELNPCLGELFLPITISYYVF